MYYIFVSVHKSINIKFVLGGLKYFLFKTFLKFDGMFSNLESFNFPDALNSVNSAVGAFSNDLRALVIEIFYKVVSVGKAGILCICVSLIVLHIAGYTFN